MTKSSRPIKGRGAVNNPHARYNRYTSEEIDDGWHQDEELPALETTVQTENSKSIITYNQSPDLPFDRSINVYRGCEHGCIYCFARPTHAYYGLSPGLDFETRLFVKPEAASLLSEEIQKKTYQCAPIALGTNTDPYQPIERKWQLTRQILEVLHQHNHPVTIVTKSSLIERDIDILEAMSKQQLAHVMISVTTLDKALARKLEPRAVSPARRLQTIKRLIEREIPTSLMVAPIIPHLTDYEIERIIEAADECGVVSAHSVLLRLPLEVATLFSHWLETYFPLKKQHVLNNVRNTRSGKLNDAAFGQRFKGEGAYASMITQRFNLKCKQLGLARKSPPLATHLFRKRIEDSNQLDIFNS
ncbi:MAG: PA0069 family radical SAM protein [Methylococcaceae bacterium]